MSINKKFFSKLLVEFLIKCGTDWVDYKRIRESGLQFEVGRLERMGYLEYEHNEVSGGISYRLTDKGLALLKENDRE
jgi:DNA-binding transcriptional regulator PaaX